MLMGERRLGQGLQLELYEVSVQKKNQYILTCRNSVTYTCAHVNRQIHALNLLVGNWRQRSRKIVRVSSETTLHAIRTNII
jgi:hypothetical protein